MSEFTVDKDVARKETYVNRHKRHENEIKSGVDTAGWWSLNIHGHIQPKKTHIIT
jgi:hypothetical protein